MLRRNKNPPLPPSKQALELPASQFPPPTRPPLLSPPNIFHRLERKPKQQCQPRSSSLNTKLKKRVFPGQQEAYQPPHTTVTLQNNHYEIINDYFPVRADTKPLHNNIKEYPSHQQQPVRSRKQIVIPSIHSAPDLPTNISPLETEDRDKRDLESVSTQMSKQSENQLKNSLKEVKFGGVVEQERNLFMKKRDKVRSPSILKNSSRNILNGSMVSGQKDRSCSVASGKERRTAGKEKAGGNSINNAVKLKYKAILNKLQTDSQTGGQGRGNRFSGAVYNSQKAVIKSPYKYKDDIFPPVYSSLFCLKKNRPKIGEQIRWMRISQLYKQKQIVLAQPHSTSIQITKRDQGYCEDYFPGGLNCILGCPKLLQKMFQNQSINPYGIYIVKIYQQCTWKYIIIDDYIPVIKTKDGFEPAFTNVKALDDHPIDIWPYLLQKAYANYYSSYQALQYGNMIDLAEEIAGNPSQIIQLKVQSPRKKDKMSPQEIETNLKKFLKCIKAGNTLVIGQLCGDKGYAPLVYDLNSSQLYWNDPFCQFKKRKLSSEGIKQTFKAVHVIFPFKMSHCSTTVLRKTRPSIKKKQLQGLYQSQLPSIRTFKVDQTGDYTLSIRQRDKRFFHFKQKHGQYIWCRAILLQKEYQDCGYRWIDGCYSQKKSINFSATLQPGEYWLVLEPQWRNNSANELMIHIYSRHQQQFRRQVYKQEQRIIQKGCLDLAQRFGELNQINKFICSYNYITEKVGLIIQNIVNQRVTGNVSVMRSIRGLTCKSEILPVNAQFYQKVATQCGEMLKLSEEIQLDIPNGQHFTVVLKLKGGIDTKFFRTFDFGC